MSDPDFYALLGVDKNASTADITKAFRNKAKTAHPDRGGSEEGFQQLNAAYEVLKDPEKRKLYDLGGLKGLESGGQQGGDFGDIFDLFAGGRRRQAKPSGPKKNDPVTYPLQLTLEDMYKGVTKKLRLTRTLCCEACNGEGGEKISCSSCGGRGAQVITQRMGNMISQQQVQCGSCRGQGKMIKPGKICVGCQGKQTKSESTTVEVVVPPGALHEQTVSFIGAGDQLPGYSMAGDIIISFQQKPHDTFERKGFHLFKTQKITLFQALTGFTIYIKHLDGHEVQIQSQQVIKPGHTICIAEEGMPHSYGQGKGIDVGSLYVTFDVEFPTAQHMQQIASNPNALTILSSILPVQHKDARTKPLDASNVTQHSQRLIPDMSTEKRKFDTEEKQWQQYKDKQERAQQTQHSHYDDDDEGPSVQMGPGCQQI